MLIKKESSSFILNVTDHHWLRTILNTIVTENHHCMKEYNVIVKRTLDKKTKLRQATALMLNKLYHCPTWAYFFGGLKSYNGLHCSKLQP
jgi:hypothetical protein